MKKEDSFLRRIPRLSEIHKVLDKTTRFGEYNEKTLGFEVVSYDLYRYTYVRVFGAVVLVVDFL